MQTLTRYIGCAGLVLWQITLAPFAIAAETPTTEAHAETESTAPVPAANFDRLKTLTGEWIDVSGSSVGKGKVAAIYHVTSGGSVVQETLFPGSSHEMVSMYTADGDHVVMSHYCAMGNQSRMRARFSTNGELVLRSTEAAWRTQAKISICIMD